MKHLEVAALVLIENNRVFCAQRKANGPLGGKWEFPGGKLESGEDGKSAIIREIREELGIEIEVESLVMTTEHQYDSFSLTMHAYLGKKKAGKITLYEHQDSKWLDADQLHDLDWAAADLPVVDAVLQLLRR